MCSVEDGEEEIEYGKMYDYALNGEKDSISTKRIWPNWNEGVPTKLRNRNGSPEFTLGRVTHHYREYYETIDLNWSGSYLLKSLEGKRNHFLPSTRRSDQWSGVYRLFLPDTTIGRFCGEDQTGTIYLGVAGTGNKNWSILQTRLRMLANGEHHAVKDWNCHETISRKYPWSTLSVQWAFTGERVDYKGDKVSAAQLAETWLLRSYHDSFGEYPPLNQKG